jgi:hypothetical protein
LKRFTSVLAVAAVSLSCLVTSATPTFAAGVNKTIKQIDTECNAVQDAIMALHPVHLAFVSNKWKVLTTSEYAIAEKTHESITFVDAWKQGSNYAWIHAHTFDASGNQRATQLCFRQSNGSLERVRQATTLSNLNAASAQVAYYSNNGKVIQKTSLFEVNDPAIAKQISALPYYNVLP